MKDYSLESITKGDFESFLKLAELIKKDVDTECSWCFKSKDDKNIIEALVTKDSSILEKVYFCSSCKLMLKDCLAKVLTETAVSRPNIFYVYEEIQELKRRMKVLEEKNQNVDYIEKFNAFCFSNFLTFESYNVEEKLNLWLSQIPEECQHCRSFQTFLISIEEFARRIGLFVEYLGNPDQRTFSFKLVKLNA
jgi:hypothetical protein